MSPGGSEEMKTGQGAMSSVRVCVRAGLLSSFMYGHAVK